MLSSCSIFLHPTHLYRVPEFYNRTAVTAAVLFHDAIVFLHCYTSFFASLQSYRVSPHYSCLSLQGYKVISQFSLQLLAQDARQLQKKLCALLGMQDFTDFLHDHEVFLNVCFHSRTSLWESCIILNSYCSYLLTPRCSFLFHSSSTTLTLEPRSRIMLICLFKVLNQRCFPYFYP